MIQEIKPAIWQILGKQPGRNVVIIGGTHGNERTGVEVVSKLKSMIESGRLNIIRGTLVLIHGNPRAIEINERGSEPHADLNRSYLVDLLEREPTGIYEDQRAREIAPLLIVSDVVVDLHATNKPSEPFIACADSSGHEQVYQWFPSKKVLSDPNYVLAGKLVTTDEFVDAHGGTGLCYETGQAGDVTRVDEVMRNVINLLIDQNLVEGEVRIPSNECEIYEMIEPIVLTAVGFTFAEGFGNGSWEPFVADQTIGYHGDVPLVATYDGVVVFPKIQELRKEGSPLAYLAKKVNERKKPPRD